MDSLRRQCLRSAPERPPPPPLRRVAAERLKGLQSQVGKEVVTLSDGVSPARKTWGEAHTCNGRSGIPHRISKVDVRIDGVAPRVAVGVEREGVVVCPVRRCKRLAPVREPTLDWGVGVPVSGEDELHAAGHGVEAPDPPQQTQSGGELVGMEDFDAATRLRSVRAAAG